MNNEFRGRSIEEVVHKAVRGRLSCKADPQKCQQIRAARQRWESALDQHDAKLENVKSRLKRLQGRVEDEERTAIVDGISTVANAAGVIASIFPAIRAVQTGIRAYRAASSVARAVAAGDSLSSAIAAVSVASVFGLGFLKPSTKQQLREAQADFEETTRQIARIGGILAELAVRLDREGCGFVDT